MSTERERLAVYDKLRDMHRILREITQREDEWEQNALDAVQSVLYLAEHVFVCTHPETRESFYIAWKKAKFRKESHANKSKS